MSQFTSPSLNQAMLGVGSPSTSQTKFLSSSLRINSASSPLLVITGLVGSVGKVNNKSISHGINLFINQLRFIVIGIETFIQASTEFQTGTKQRISVAISSNRISASQIESLFVRP